MRNVFHHLRRQSIALLALAVALGGTSYAAVQLPRNSVGGKQLRSGSVTTSKISLKTRKALRGARGFTGPAGAVGATGPQGPAGQDGAPGKDGAAGFSKVIVRTASSGAASIQSGTSASCFAGQKAVGGGVQGIPSGGSVPVVIESQPSPAKQDAVPTAWNGSVRNVSANGTVTANVYVVCAS